MLKKTISATETWQNPYSELQREFRQIAKELLAWTPGSISTEEYDTFFAPILKNHQRIFTQASKGNYLWKANIQSLNELKKKMPNITSEALHLYETSRAIKKRTDYPFLVMPNQNGKMQTPEQLRDPVFGFEF